MHNFGEEKIKPKKIWLIILKKYTSISIEKKLINSEYKRLSKSSLTGAMKSILIKLGLQLCRENKTTNVLLVVEIKVKYVDKQSFYHQIL